MLARTRLMATTIACLETGTPRRVDELCPKCFLPTMFEVPLYLVTEAGVSPLGSWTGCPDCDGGEQR